MSDFDIVSFSGEYRFLSNFYPAVVQLDGLEFPTVEHAYQAAKTLNLEARALIQSLASPARAKRAGQQVVLRENWEHDKVAVMHDLLTQKFADPDLAQQLLATGQRNLVEGNTWGDTFWGVCDGVGLNWLGKLLMTVRTDLYVSGPR